MFSKAKKTERIDIEQREQYEYAQARMKQKKKLMQHFIVFLVGSVFLIIINPILGYGDEFFIKNWTTITLSILGLIFVYLLVRVFTPTPDMSELNKYKLEEIDKHINEVF